MLDSVENAEPSLAAVSIIGAAKLYKKCGPVLNGLNMTVPFWSIYGLLGSSGCGKTTILSSILGQLKLDSGEIRIFGDLSKGNLSGVPGKNVGYMPQEMSLYPTFTIKETVNFFGGLNGMTRNEIKTRYQVLANVLDLPDDTRIVGTLSGGQQRRVSLATALIHKPKLLILDEPTVGLDPLVRSRIWSYLNNLTRQKETTVVITTHYIEECKSADYIGVMREGRLIAEKPPSDLLREYETDNLQTVVFLLMRKASQSLTSSRINSNQIVEPLENKRAISSFSPTLLMGKDSGRSFCLKRLLTLMRKNITVFYRNLWFLLFVIAVPALIVYAFVVSYGSTPMNLGIGILNLELNNQSLCLNNNNSASGKCSGDLLSCLYLKSIPQSSFRMRWMDSENLAVKATQAGDIHGYIIFPNNFSESLVARNMFSGNVSEITWNSSQIKIRLDETSAQLSIAIKHVLYKAYEDFMTSILTDCGFDSRLGESSLKYHSPVYGSDEIDQRPFFAPGVALALIFFYPTITTSIRLIGDKNSGVMRRSLASGVQFIEIVLADIVTEFPVLLCQTLLTYVIITVVLGTPILGSSVLFIVIFLLAGYAGVSAGFLMATLCDDEFQAAVISNGTFMPSILISGILWPVEGMSVWLAYVAPLWPCTLSAEAIRSITGRGWGLTHPSVWPGVLVPAFYIIFFLFLNFVIRRHFRN